MAHQEQKNFCLQVKQKFREVFDNPNAKILDCGSLDINGNNRYLFASKDYTGIDLGPGRNVDVVSRIHEFDAESASFDIVISTECLEHDKFYGESLRNMLRMLKPGGLLLLTCATTGRPEHGTHLSTIGDSPFTLDYYKNLEADDIRDSIPMEAFEAHGFSVNARSHDLYFWGVKRG